jgi:tetratricopeptide (TPR) repeat protein
MSPITLGSVARAILAAGIVTAFASAPALANDDGPPAPKIDCSKASNKNKPACKPHNGALSDDEVFNAAYWLAHDGQYGEALALLSKVKNKDDPRVLSATGFATRKLGNVDGAFPFYARALEIKPDYVQAREYLGEAYLSKGDLAHASEQLGEIERRCGQSCVAYTDLARHIDEFKAAQTQRG